MSGKPKELSTDPMKVALRAIREDLAYWKAKAERAEAVVAAARIESGGHGHEADCELCMALAEYDADAR